MYTAAYITLIVAVNYGFSVVPLLEMPGGEMWPPMSLVVGLVFVVRDFAQREVGHRVILAMLLAGGLSYVMASPFVAVASFTGKKFHERVLLSSVIATPIDSVVFLAIIGHLSISGVVAMTASKLLGALVVWWLLKRKIAQGRFP